MKNSQVASRLSWLGQRVVLPGAAALGLAVWALPAWAAEEPAPAAPAAANEPPSAKNNWGIGDLHEHSHHEAPKMDTGLELSPYDPAHFRPDPQYQENSYDYQAQLDIYGAKRRVDSQRPWIELGRELYTAGPFQPSETWLGKKNPVYQHLWMFGDYRTAVAYNDNGNAEQARWANRLNLNLDYQFTATERIHYFFRPLDKNNEFTGVDFGGENHEGTGLFDDHVDFNADALFFEGELGQLWSGFTDTHAKFDVSFTAGIIPLLYQNGTWMQDAFTGFAFAIPGRNMRVPYISNFDLVFFAGFDRVTTGAIPDDDDAHVYGITGMFEMLEGYLEVGYGYLNDVNSDDDFSYHNFSVSFTRRYGNFISNSVRLIANVGQDPENSEQLADGFIILIDNSFMTGQDQQTIVPYFNMFFGFDKPQSLARDGGAGGVLLNTGILFETDGLTGFPKMDDSGFDTLGAAAGIEFLFDLNMQLVFEAAVVAPRGDADDRNAAGTEVGFGVRYQLPITNAVLLRFDAMYAHRDEAEDLSGARFEIRYKF